MLPSSANSSNIYTDARVPPSERHSCRCKGNWKTDERVRLKGSWGQVLSFQWFFWILWNCCGTQDTTTAWNGLKWAEIQWTVMIDDRKRPVQRKWESQFLGRLIRSLGPPQRRTRSGALKEEIRFWNSQGGGKGKHLFFFFFPLSIP